MRSKKETIELLAKLSYKDDLELGEWVTTTDPLFQKFWNELSKEERNSYLKDATSECNVLMET